jgi:hypothetical protein
MEPGLQLPGNWPVGPAVKRPRTFPSCSAVLQRGCHGDPRPAELVGVFPDRRGPTRLSGDDAMALADECSRDGLIIAQSVAAHCGRQARCRPAA